MNPKRFRIAFSFTGERRAFVQAVADLLAKKFGEAAILYDKYLEAEFARRDLGLYLPDLYCDQSDLVVVVVCPDYDKKDWTGLEWIAIHELLTKRRDEEVMLCRFERATVKGVHLNAGWIELDQKTPDQAATLILERLALNEGQPKDHYTQPTVTNSKPLSTSIPNNLPRIQSFFGREAELAQIREALDPEARTWGALIDGPGGMGKTSLAVRAANECTPDQFQRIVFLSAKDREMDAAGEHKLTGFILPSFLEMLNELARELNQPAIPKAPEDQRIKLLLDALRPTQTLLILDNLESLTKDDRDQLFNFVKRLPQGCKAILTSRGRIGSGSEELILEQLDETAALATLSDLARHNKLLAKTSEAERLTIYKQTGGKPLLLRWVAGQLGRGSCRTFTDALAFLQSCPKDNDPLEYTFGDLIGDFTPEETRVLCALTYFSLPVKVEPVAEVAGLTKAQVETALRSLANRSLVVPDQEEVAFALVPMVAEFLRRKRPDVVAEAGNQLEKRAYALIVENGYQNHARFPILDAAWPTVAPALPLFIAGASSRLQTVCDALNFFLNFTGRWDEWLSVNLQAETKAEAAADHNNAGWRAYQAGISFDLRGQADLVLGCAERAAQHWEKAHAGPRERASAINLRGLGQRSKENYPAAIAACREALELWRSLSKKETMEVAVGLNDLANAERDSGENEAAERDYREALRVAKVVGDAESIAAYTGNLAAMALTLKEWKRAEDLAREALTLAEDVGRKALIASNCRRVAKALAQQEKKAEGLPYAQRAVKIFTELGSRNLEDATQVMHECEE